MRTGWYLEALPAGRQDSSTTATLVPRVAFARNDVRFADGENFQNSEPVLR